jgi:hypothetical protein
MMLTDPTFWRAAAERAVKTFAQSLAALLVADGTDVLSTDWGARLSVAAMAAVVSVLTSVGSAQVGDDGPSLGGEVLAKDARVEPLSQDRLDAMADPLDCETDSEDYR